MAKEACRKLAKNTELFDASNSDDGFCGIMVIKKLKVEAVPREKSI